MYGNNNVPYGGHNRIRENLFFNLVIILLKDTLQQINLISVLCLTIQLFLNLILNLDLLFIFRLEIHLMLLLTLLVRLNSLHLM